jgi:hypothetical protein
MSQESSEYEARSSGSARRVHEIAARRSEAEVELCEGEPLFDER